MQARIPAHPPPCLSQRSRAVLTRRSRCALARKVDCVSWSAEGMLAVVSGSTVRLPLVHMPSPCRARYACAARRADLSTTHTQHRRGSAPRGGAGNSACEPQSAAAGTVPARD